MRILSIALGGMVAVEGSITPDRPIDRPIDVACYELKRQIDIFKWDSKVLGKFNAISNQLTIGEHEQFCPGLKMYMDGYTKEGEELMGKVKSGIEIMNIHAPCLRGHCNPISVVALYNINRSALEGICPKALKDGEEDGLCFEKVYMKLEGDR